MDLRERLRDGLWFPWVNSALNSIFGRLPGSRVNAHLGDVRGASELYVAATVFAAALWLSLVNVPLHPVFADPFASRLASVIPVARATEILFFSLHWVFVAGEKLEGVRRSLASFLLNLIELAILFSLARVLAGCVHAPALDTFLESVLEVFTLQVPAHPTGYSWCGFLAFDQWLIAGLVVTIAVASLVGGVLREERKLPSTQSKRPPSPPELAASIPHLAFEQAAMRAAAGKCSGASDRFAFEAFLMHVRVLRSFYFDQWSERGQWAESTIVAELYFPRPADWRTVKGATDTPHLKNTKDAIDKQLAHLTKERTQAFASLEGVVGDLQNELDALWDHFLDKLGNHRDVGPFRSALADKCRELGCP